MGKFSRLGKNTFFVFVGNIGSKLIGLLMLPFYTRWLSVEDYGITDIIIVYTTLLFSVVGGGLSDAIFIFPKSQNRNVQKQFYSSGVIGAFVLFLITAGIFGIIDIFSTVKLWDNSFTNYLWWIYLFLLSMFVQQFIQQFCRSIDKIKIYSFTGIIQTLGVALFSFFLIPKWGIYGFIISQFVANFIASLYSFIASYSYEYFKISFFRKRRLIEMLRYSIPLIPNGVMWWLVSALSRPIMENTLGLHSIGIFAVANKFPGLLSMLFAVFMSAWQISVIEEFAKPGYQEFYNKVFRSFVNLLFVVFIIISMFSLNFVKILTADEYLAAAKYIPLLTLGALFSGISTIVGCNFSATRESKFYFYSSIWGAVSSVIANLLLIPIFHIWGAALSIVISFAVMMLSRSVYARKYVTIMHKGYYLLLLLLSVFFIVASLVLPITWLYMCGIATVGILVYLNKGFTKSVLVYIKTKVRNNL